METVIRVAILFVFVVAGLRVLGKREFSQMSALELVMLLLIGQFAVYGVIQADYSLTNALVAISTLFVLVLANSFLEHRWPRYRDVVTGTPAVVVAHGEFQKGVMDRERVNPEEVFERMHQMGLERLEQVKWGILESDGKISIVPNRRDSDTPIAD